MSYYLVGTSHIPDPARSKAPPPRPPRLSGPVKTSSLSWTTTGQTNANAAAVKIGAAPTVTLIRGPGASSSTHVIPDAGGYHLP